MGRHRIDMVGQVCGTLRVTAPGPEFGESSWICRCSACRRWSLMLRRQLVAAPACARCSGTRDRPVDETRRLAQQMKQHDPTLTLRAIADRLGVSKQRVSQCLNRPR